MNTTYVRTQDAASVYVDTSYNPAGTDLVWDTLKSQFNEVNTVVGGLYPMAYVIEAVTSSFNTECACLQIEKFMRDQADSIGRTSRVFEQSLEKCHSNIKWMNTNLEKIERWLNEQQI